MFLYNYKQDVCLLRTLQPTASSVFFFLCKYWCSFRPTFAAAVITIELSICRILHLRNCCCCCSVKNSCNWVTDESCGWQTFLLRLKWEPTNCDVNNNLRSRYWKFKKRRSAKERTAFFIRDCVNCCGVTDGGNGYKKVPNGPVRSQSKLVSSTSPSSSSSTTTQIHSPENVKQ